MAFLASRTSRGQKYWSIVESRRINGKPKHIIQEYLGTAETLLERLKTEDNLSVKSYSHGDTHALLSVVHELNLISIINKYIPALKNSEKPIRDNLTVGASFILAAIGRACHPSSKMGWYDWCHETSLEYSLKSSFKSIDSQHFWDQMNFLPVSAIPMIEEEILKSLQAHFIKKMDTLFFDTSNFFTFIDSANQHCQIPQRGKNKQKRDDLRQFGLALLVSREGQFPLFHKTYEGNKTDVTLFKETAKELFARLKALSNGLTDVTLVFDKGNNSRENFKILDSEPGIHYVGGLVSSYFKELICEANKGFEPIDINDEQIPAFRTKKEIWGAQRTCVVLVSSQLLEGQLRGIQQHLEKKYKVLAELKAQLENPKGRTKLKKVELQKRLQGIIRGQFIEDILKCELIKLKWGGFSFTYFIDQLAFETLKKEVLGRKILVTSRHDWTSADIILAYRGQSRVEAAFRELKNPYHLAVRPQYHWTDQKIQTHVLICILGYILTMAVYQRARQAGYKGSVNRLMEELKTIRLSCRLKKKGTNIKYQLETIPDHLLPICKALHISDDSIRPKINLSVYE